MISAGRKPVGTEPYNIPINELDRCAYEHDAVFSRNNNAEKNIRDADIKFRECASKIKDANLKYYIQIQLAKTAIGLKEFGEDIGIIKPELFAYINKSVNDLNQTLAKNHTIPSTKEEQQEEDRNFYIASLMMFFRVGVDLIIPIGTRLTTEQLLKFVKSKNIDLMTLVPTSLRPFFERIVNNLMGRRDGSNIVSSIVDLGQTELATYIRGLLKDSDIFGTGVSGYIIKLGYTKFVKLLIDNYLTKLSIQFGSNSWRQRNVMTAEELDEIIEGKGADIYRAETQRNQEIGRFIGFDLNNARIIGLTNLFRFIENLSNREKISEFGNFYRDIITIRNEREDGILTVVYLLLTGSYRTQFTANITVEKLREILNQKISNDDIRILLNRPILIDKLKRLFDTNTIDDSFLRDFTYMNFIDKILRDLTITQNGLKDLLS